MKYQLLQQLILFNTARLDMRGPANAYFGFGFGNNDIAGTYAIVITENGNVYEYSLVSGFKSTNSTNITSDITIESNIFTSNIDNLEYGRN